MNGVFKLDRIKSEEGILIMDISNRYRNMLNPSCEVIFFYDVSCRLSVTKYGVWSIEDLEAKVYRMGGTFLWPSRRCRPRFLLIGMQRLVGYCLTNIRQHQ